MARVSSPKSPVEYCAIGRRQCILSQFGAQKERQCDSAVRSLSLSFSCFACTCQGNCRRSSWDVRRNGCNTPRLPASMSASSDQQTADGGPTRQGNRIDRIGPDRVKSLRPRGERKERGLYEVQGKDNQVGGKMFLNRYARTHR